MSWKNVEIVRRLVDAVADQDVALLIELTDPDVEWQSFSAELQEGGVYRGHDGIRGYVQDIGETFDYTYLEVEDTLVVGSVVLVVGRLRYRGKGSGIEYASPAGYVVKMRGGRVLLLRTFRDPERVFEAVGLRE